MSERLATPSLRIGTRGSQLALWQAHTVAAAIAAAGGPACTVVTIKTSGDRLQEAPLSEVGGKRLFVKEIEDALLRGEVDLAVHSSKDMPAVLPDGLSIAAVLPREDPLDAIVLPVRVRLKADPTHDTSVSLRADPAHDNSARVKADPAHVAVAGEYVGSAFRRTFATIDELVAELGQTPTIGTSSVRRIAQLTRMIPGARFTPIRGNLDTRLRKLDGAEYDALVLAAAGLRRLGFASRISMALPSAACVPSPGQGIVAIEIRSGDERVRRVVTRIDDPAAAAALEAERAVVTALGGGCQTPIGALASPIGVDALELVAAVVALDGSRAVRTLAQGPVADPGALGRQVAARLLDEGAGEILAEARRQQSTVDGP